MGNKGKTGEGKELMIFLEILYKYIYNNSLYILLFHVVSF